MKPMISDAAPLIFLSRIGKLNLLQKLFKEIIIPRAVQKEVLVEGKPGYAFIQEAIADQWIKIKNPRQIMELSLGYGESEAISLAKETNDTLLLDDAYAIRAAKMYEIDTIRTTTVLFLAAHKKIITTSELIQLLNELINVGYYIRPSEYASLLSRVREYSNYSKSQK